MKRIDFRFAGGKSPNIFVAFYEENLLEALQSAPSDDFDESTFLTEHEAKSVWVARGMNREGWPEVEVFEDGVQVHTLGHNHLYLYPFEGDIDEEDFVEMLKSQETGGVDPKTLLAGYSGREIDVHSDDRFFGGADKYKYASVERVETYGATATVSIDADDDYQWSDFELIYADNDSGPDGSMAQILYQEGGLETELIGVKYKGKVYELDSEYEGGTSDWSYYELDEDGDWVSCYELESTLDELRDPW